MPWKETCPMDERLKSIADCLKDECSLSDLCQYYGISRKGGYKWLARYLAEGPSGLHDRSRAPVRLPTVELLKVGQVYYRSKTIFLVAVNRPAWILYR